MKTLWDKPPENRPDCPELLKIVDGLIAEMRSNQDVWKPLVADLNENQSPLSEPTSPRALPTFVFPDESVDDSDKKPKRERSKSISNPSGPQMSTI